jgi:hypothetical protein
MSALLGLIATCGSILLIALTAYIIIDTIKGAN